MNAVCNWRLQSPDLDLKDIDPEKMRAVPLGCDADGFTYWRFTDDAWIFRESISDDHIKPQKKPAGRKRKAASGSASAPTAPLWSAVTSTLSEVETLAETLSKTRHGAQKKLALHLLEELLPSLQEKLKAVERAQKREAIREFAPRKSSSRIQALSLKKQEEDRLRELQEAARVEAEELAQQQRVMEEREAERLARAERAEARKAEIELRAQQEVAEREARQERLAARRAQAALSAVTSPVLVAADSMTPSISSSASTPATTIQPSLNNDNIGGLEPNPHLPTDAKNSRGIVRLPRPAVAPITPTNSFNPDKMYLPAQSFAAFASDLSPLSLSAGSRARQGMTPEHPQQVQEQVAGSGNSHSSISSMINITSHGALVSEALTPTQANNAITPLPQASQSESLNSISLSQSGSLCPVTVQAQEHDKSLLARATQTALVLHKQQSAIATLLTQMREQYARLGIYAQTQPDFQQHSRLYHEVSAQLQQVLTSTTLPDYQVINSYQKTPLS